MLAARRAVPGFRSPGCLENFHAQISRLPPEVARIVIQVESNPRQAHAEPVPAAGQFNAVGCMGQAFTDPDHGAQVAAAAPDEIVQIIPEQVGPAHGDAQQVIRLGAQADFPLPAAEDFRAFFLLKAVLAE